MAGDVDVDPRRTRGREEGDAAVAGVCLRLFCFFASPFDLAGRSERPIAGLGWRDAVASRGHVLEACPRGAFVEKCFFLFLGCW